MNKTKLINKIISGALALSMSVAMISMIDTTAYATDTSTSSQPMAFGASGVKARDISGGGTEQDMVVYEGDRIVMGEYDGSAIEWVRLNDDGLMLSAKSLWRSTFEASASGYYPYSTLNIAMIDLYNNNDLNLTAEEKALIKDTTLAAESMHADIAVDLTGQKFFPLSGNHDRAGEFFEYLGFGTNLAKYSSIDSWWLRSSESDIEAFSSWLHGAINGNHLDDRMCGARPAHNIDLSPVLFTSAAVSGKAAFNSSHNSLQAISGTTPTIWKMTLLDSTRTFTVTEEPTVTWNTVEFDYENATTGENEYISVMIVDSSNNITHYAKVENLRTTADGSASFTTPSGVVGDVTLKIFNEQANGDNKTDYSSAFVEFTVTIPPPPPSKYSLVVNYGSGDGNFEAGTWITITAENRTGYTFSHWASNEVTFEKSKAETTRFIMNSKNVEVTAIYTLNGAITQTTPTQTANPEETANPDDSKEETASEETANPVKTQAPVLEGDSGSEPTSQDSANSMLLIIGLGIVIIAIAGFVILRKHKKSE